jgi:two-component system, OmpR family, response regulator
VESRDRIVVLFLLSGRNMIVIADRIRVMGEMLARRFEADGIHARSVADAAELLAVVAQGKTHAVVLDPMLPGNAGLGALIRLRALEGECAAVPVLILSTSDSAESIETAKRLGCNDYAVKGRESPTQLVLRTRMLVENQRAAPQVSETREVPS